MKDRSIWYLENFDADAIFCPQKMDNSTHNHESKSFKKGEFIYLPNQDANKIYFITEGSVKIGSYNDQNKEITKAIISKGELFGEMSIINNEKRRDFALAMEKVSLCIMTVDDLKDMLLDHKPLSVFFMKIMGSRVLEMEQRLESLVFKDSRSRIIEFLVNMVNKKGQRVGFEWVVRKFITHQEIANLTATSRQTVTTVLNELRNDGKITFDRRRLLVRDLDSLKADL